MSALGPGSRLPPRSGEGPRGDGQEAVIESNLTDIEGQVRTYVVDTFLFGDAAGLTETQSLLVTGVLDSTGVMELILFLETTFGVAVEDTEVVPANLDSIRSIAAFVDRKLASKRAQPAN